MKPKNQKIKRFSWLFLLIWLFGFLFFADLAMAAKAPDIQVDIGSFSKADFQDIPCNEGEPCPIDWISQYVAALYRYGIGIAATLVVVMIMVGGFLWLTSGGSPDRISKAKEFITAALSGLLLALFSYMILYTINPRLTALEPVIVNVPSVSSGSSDPPLGPSTGGGAGKFSGSTGESSGPSSTVDPDVDLDADAGSTCCQQNFGIDESGHVLFSCYMDDTISDGLCNLGGVSKGNTVCNSTTNICE